MQGGASFVVSDEIQREMVRAIIETAAPGMSGEEAIKNMSDAGVRSRKPRGRGASQPVFVELGDRKSATMIVWQHLPTYSFGRIRLPAEPHGARMCRDPRGSLAP